ncbi:uncharacterized protein LOC135805660 isoform X1 [Sycon ciliatum]|uniref:uncharacterized protein LOC135805660 isoform X1 n=1 Tax=Sycon ciliatum TaxID=27933 RepID=UPI0031F7152B
MAADNPLVQIPSDQFLTTAKVAVRKSSSQGDWLSACDALYAFQDLGMCVTFGQVVEIMVTAMKCQARYTCCTDTDKMPEKLCLLYGEFCWYAAQFLHAFWQCRTQPGRPDKPRILQTVIKPLQDSQQAVFLGGACNPTDWRERIAIPFMEKHNITYHNPQVREWYEGVIDLESKAKRQAKISLVLVDEETRCVSSLIDAAYLCAVGVGIAPVMRMTYKRHPSRADCAVQLGEDEALELNYARALLVDYAESNGVRVYSSLEGALDTIRETLTSSEGVAAQHLPSWEESGMRLGSTINAANQAFMSGAEPTGDDGQCYRMSGKRARQSIMRLHGISSSDIDVTIPMITLNYSEYMSFAALMFLKAKEHAAPGWKAMLPAFQEPNPSSCSTLLSSAKHTVVSSARRWMRDRFPSPMPLIDDVDNPGQMVFLGGSCGNTAWRQRIAIPHLQRAGVAFYNPQTAPGTWEFGNIPEQINYMKTFGVLLFVITSETRSTASLVDASFNIGLMQQSIITYIQDVSEDGNVAGEALSRTAVQDYNRGRAYLRNVCRERNIPMYVSIEKALQSCVNLICKGYPLRDGLTESAVVPSPQVAAQSTEK